MDVLGNLLDGPKGPTRLAQACNLTFDTMSKAVTTLIARNFVQLSVKDGHDSYSITPSGVEIRHQVQEILGCALFRER